MTNRIDTILALIDEAMYQLDAGSDAGVATVLADLKDQATQAAECADCGDEDGHGGPCMPDFDDDPTAGFTYPLDKFSDY